MVGRWVEYLHGDINLLPVNLLFCRPKCKIKMSAFCLFMFLTHCCFSHNCSFPSFIFCFQQPLQKNGLRIHCTPFPVLPYVWPKNSFHDLHSDPCIRRIFGFSLFYLDLSGFCTEKSPGWDWIGGGGGCLEYSHLQKN